MSISVEEYAKLVKRPNKYKAQSTVVDGIRFDSKGEARRWQTLQLQEYSGDIYNLTRQVPYRLEVNGVLIGKYVCDFRYVEKKTDEVVVEDWKSPATVKRADYRMKKALMKALYGIEIREVMA